MTLPNFLVVGAMKAGTTSLHHYLQDHPDIHLPDRYENAGTKEFNFFTEAHNWNRGLAWYAAHFEDAGSAVAIGEVSPNYAKHPEHPGVPKRIHSVMPDARLVYLVRQPIERTVSHYLHAVGKGREGRSIDLALAEEPAYVDQSCYWMQIEQYLRWFPSERVLVVLTEDLRDHRSRTLRRILDFLEVDSGWEAPRINHLAHRTADKRAPRALARNGTAQAVLARMPDPLQRAALRATTKPLSSVPTEISPAMRRSLEARLRPDVARLSEFAGRDLDLWGLSP